MRSGRPARIDGEALVIGFEYDFHRGKVAEDSNRRVVEDVLTKLLGRRLQVRCALAEEESPAPQAPSPPALPHEEDGLIQEAVEKLGAQVREVE